MVPMERAGREGRLRCSRLVDDSTSEALAVRMLLAHRRPLDLLEVELEWFDLLNA